MREVGLGGIKSHCNSTWVWGVC